MKCQRCDQETSVHVMSMFDQSEICMDCKRAERLHQRYREATDAERAAVQRGEMNFPGIGLPADLEGGGHYLLRRVEVEGGLVVVSPRNRAVPRAILAHHIVANEDGDETLCGLDCRGWSRPFLSTLWFALPLDDRFCRQCADRYAGQPAKEEDCAD